MGLWITCGRKKQLVCGHATPIGNFMVFYDYRFTRTVFPSLAHASTQQASEYLKAKWNLNGVNNRYFYIVFFFPLVFYFFSFSGDERASAFSELWIWPNSSFYPNEYWKAKLLCPSNKCKKRQKQRGEKQPWEYVQNLNLKTTCINNSIAPLLRLLKSVTE